MITSLLEARLDDGALVTQALLGLRRVVRLLADGRAIPTPGGATAASARRWSTYVSPAAKTAQTLLIWVLSH